VTGDMRNEIDALKQQNEKSEKTTNDLKDQMKTKTNECSSNNNNGLCHETEFLHKNKELIDKLVKNITEYTQDMNVTTTKKYDAIDNNFETIYKKLADQSAKLDVVIQSQPLEGKLKDYFNCEITRQLAGYDQKQNELENLIKNQTQTAFYLTQEMKNLGEENKNLLKALENSKEMNTNTNRTLAETNK